MRIIILTICCALVPIILSSQITPTIGYDDVETEIQDESSDYFYPLLLQKYESIDSILSETESIYLYYGWVFQTNYNPIENMPFLDSLNKYMNSEYGYGDDLDMLLTFCDSVLVEEPLNLGVLNYKLYFYKKLGMELAFDETRRKITLIFDAITSSGNGTSMDDAMFVVDQSHAASILKEKLHKYMGESTIVDRFQYLKTSYDGEEFMLYFNIEPSLNYISEM